MEKFNFDFSKPEDQKKFDNKLESHDKDVVISRAKSEAAEIQEIAITERRGKLNLDSSFADYYKKRKEVDAAPLSADDLKNAEIIFQRSAEKAKKWSDARFKTTVSVKDLIPGINTEGLSLKPQQNTGDIFDSAKDRKLSYLPPQMSGAFSHLIYKSQVYKGKKEISEKIFQGIENVFNGQIVVDLGAGENLFGYLIADRAHAGGYVAVEPAFSYGLIQMATHTLNQELGNKQESDVNHELNETPIAIVEDDMLSFLKRLPDNSVSVWCSGVDYFVIPDHEYRSAVAKEIIRVLHPDGGYIGQNSKGDNGIRDDMHIILPDDSGISKEIVGLEDGAYADHHGAIVVYKKDVNTKK